MEYIDLGLSVKWANCNVGANSPEEYGKYFNYVEASQLEDVTLPTMEQWQELQEKCICKLDEKKAGYVIKGKNGNTIYLPLAGEGNDNPDVKVMGAFLWSSTTGTVVDVDYAYFASFTIKKKRGLDLLDQHKYYISVREIQK